MRARTGILPAILASAAMVGGTVVAGSVASDAMASARPVALADATVPPTVLVYVAPGRGYTTRHARPCRARSGRRGYFSDVSAYRWDGSALGAQTWHAPELAYVWRDHDDFAVTYNGRTFFNDTTAPVLVAGWCG